MGFRHLLLIIFVVALVITGSQAKKKKGCQLNNKIYKAGKIAYKDREHCFKLRCVKKKNKKTGKVKYVLKPTSYRNCKCIHTLCRGPRCSPPVECPACTEIWDPVCGTDNVTYSNECTLFAQLPPCGTEVVDIAYYGECGGCPVGCPKVKRPVCGSNNVTYLNECLLITDACKNNTNITVAHNGQCQKTSDRLSDNCNDKCPKVLRPVCGTNGVTYSNECLLELAACRGVEVAVAYKGRCKKCKYNGKTYAASEMIEDLIDYCLTAACQPTSNPKKVKVVFQDFQGAMSCECTRNKLRRQILRIAKM